MFAQLKHVGDSVLSQHRRPAAGGGCVTGVICIPRPTIVCRPQASVSTRLICSAPLRVAVYVEVKEPEPVPVARLNVFPSVDSRAHVATPDAVKLSVVVAFCASVAGAVSVPLDSGAMRTVAVTGGPFPQTFEPKAMNDCSSVTDTTPLPEAGKPERKPVIETVARGSRVAHSSVT